MSRRKFGSYDDGEGKEDCPLLPGYLIITYVRPTQGQGDRGGR